MILSIYESNNELDLFYLYSRAISSFLKHIDKGLESFLNYSQTRLYIFYGF